MSFWLPLITVWAYLDFLVLEMKKFLVLLNNKLLLFENKNVIGLSVMFNDFQVYDSYFLKTGNNGLRDQAAVIDWVYNTISSFGGDPSKITLSVSLNGSDLC